MRLIDADKLLKQIIETTNTEENAGMLILLTGLVNDAPTAMKWISVEDRLPEQSGYVLTCYGDYHTINVFSYSKKHRAFNAHDCLPTAENNVDVTHWMPLPEPPEEVAKAE